MHKKMGIVFISLCAVVVSGCTTTTRIGDFTIISSKNIDLSRGADFKRGTNRVIGQDMVGTSGFGPVAAPNMKTAIDRAIESVPGTIALLDGVISQRVTTWRTGYVVEGTPLIDPSLLSDSIPTPAPVTGRRHHNTQTTVQTTTQTTTQSATEPPPTK